MSHFEKVDRAQLDELVRKEIERSRRRVRYRERKEARVAKALADFLAEMPPKEHMKAVRGLADFKAALAAVEAAHAAFEAAVGTEEGGK